LNNNNGFTLVECLIGIALMSFVVISILGAFSQVQLNTRYVGDKNLALILAQSGMELMMKYPGSQLTASTTTDYAVRTNDSFTIYSSDPGLQKNQFRRTIAVTTTASALMNVEVTVEYANTGNAYPRRVTLNCQRGG
jgi:Tfp pilus assembly protein PilV